MNLTPLDKALKDSIAIRQELVQNESLKDQLSRICECILNCLKGGGKILFCGNGGSASDAQHLAAELSGRYYMNRAPLYALALHDNPAYLTAVSNDFDFSVSFARLVDAMGVKGDVLIGLSTSGNSENIIKAFKMAKEKGVTTIGFTGKGGGKMKEWCDYILSVPSEDTPRIQEAHMLLGHIVCEIVEKEYFS